MFIYTFQNISHQESDNFIPKTKILGGQKNVQLSIFLSFKNELSFFHTSAEPPYKDPLAEKYNALYENASSFIYQLLKDLELELL